MTVRRVVGSLLGAAALAGIAIAATGCGDDEALCDGAALTSALATATPGSIVRVGECEIRGHFTIPAGVTLAGPVDGTRTKFIGTGTEPVLTLQSDATNASSISDVDVDSTGTAGVLATGPGGPTIGAVRVGATRGVGIRLEGTNGARLIRCTVEGPVTAENAAAVPVGPSSTETATHGVLIVDSTAARLAQVIVRGYARFGLLAVSSDVMLESTAEAGLIVENSLGTGAMFYGGTALAEDVRVTGMLEGVQAVPAYGIVIAGGADVTTRNVVLQNGQGFGLLQDSSSSTHSGLMVTGNRFAALWTQRSSSFVVSEGVASTLSGNGLAGIVSMETDRLEVHTTRIEGTTEQVTTVGETGLRMAADGVHLMEGTGTTLLDDVTLVGNARVGLLVDVAAETDLARVTLTRVTVNASGAAAGALAQGPGGPIASGAWDASVVRLGDAAANDSRITSRFDVLGAVGPMYLPMPDM